MKLSNPLDFIVVDRRKLWEEMDAALSKINDDARKIKDVDKPWEVEGAADFDKRST